MRERRKKIAESAKITAGKFAFGETTHARPIASELAWRSLNRGLFISNNFATLSLIAQTRATHLFLSRTRAQL